MTLVDVLAFSFVSAANRKSYLARLGMRKRRSGMQRQGGGGRGKATHFLGERWRACRRGRCTGDGEVTNYSSLSAAPVFKGARIPPWESSGAERQARRLLGIPRPSIHHKPAATMLTTSFRHVVEDLVQSSGSLCRPRPKSLWSIHSVWYPPSPSPHPLPSCSLTIVFRRKKLLSQFVPFVFHRKIFRGSSS